MKIDPFFAPPPAKRPEDVTLFAGGQHTGERTIQEDALAHLNDECFVVADGVGSLPHASLAATLTANTAIWAYKVVRTRPFYWGEKLELLKRIFRSTNLTLWQKRREKGFEQGLAAALALVIIGPDNFWVGSSGNCSCFLYRESLIDELITPDIDGEGMLTKAVGFARKQLIPMRRSEKFLHDDVILLCTDGVANYVTEDQMRSVFEQTGRSADSMSVALNNLLTIARQNGSDDNMAAWLIKRITQEF
ncbi:hypothetical protein A2363_01935 [Candidatus Gottesmanbacteria bacterium RIFOXYB1_FULL_47_11]|uniref:PPM-type phosphatase domain-containing protein n=1 Tax=Candidatus Gottesmanbacteria bacterium RIFOXYB1_FULL_47_11 TaxID=1798401 RepID=A0A1F6BDI6_9BACT|nr:MAG: hypothetical protein A2363_01935 [Candidatus Gottesmanbacteria bacterium RIFOXYB1_FULL_47_11]